MSCIEPFAVGYRVEEVKKKIYREENKTNKNKRDLNPDKYLQSKLMMWEIKIN